MTVSELIEKLSNLPNQSETVLVNVHTETKAYGLAQVTPWEVCQSYSGAVIEITLPKGFSISQRKGN